MYKLPERRGGGGGGEIRAMPERKHSFFQEVFPYTTWHCRCRRCACRSCSWGRPSRRPAQRLKGLLFSSSTKPLYFTQQKTFTFDLINSNQISQINLFHPLDVWNNQGGWIALHLDKLWNLDFHASMSGPAWANIRNTLILKMGLCKSCFHLEKREKEKIFLVRVRPPPHFDG